MSVRVIVLTLSLLCCITSARVVRAQVASTHIVQLTEAAFPNRLDALRKLRDAARRGTVRSYADAYRELCLGHTRAWAAARAQALTLGGIVEHEYPVLGGAAVRLTSTAAATLANHPDVETVETDTLIGSTIANQTASFNHNANATTALGFTGAGVTLALLDSGIDLEVGAGSGVPHPAFLDAAGTRSRIVKAVGIADPLLAEDSTGHGTAVAGIATARQWGVSPAADDGFARDAHIASYRITFAESPGSTTNNAWASDWIAAWHAVLEDRRDLSIVAAVASYSGSPDPLSAEQRIVDCVAFYGDVLVASSAGNGGGLFDAAMRSQSNANGIAVASVTSGAHLHAATSSEGPLPGDPRRAWPDLAAVGVGVFAPAIDNALGTTPPISGTSFAAPCVAGAALVLRGADPTLDALTTKAILLATAADLETANPCLDRRYLGVGLLRVDHALNAALGAARFVGVAPGTGGVVSHAITATVGDTRVATLVWPRSDDRNAGWNDLDLVVRDPTGRVLARASSPRNLDETLRFTTQNSGVHTFDVIGSDVTEPTAPYALVVANDVSGARQRGAFEIDGAGCVGSGRDAVDMIFPSALTMQEGNARSATPLAGAPAKVQRALDGASIPSGETITALAFRRDASHAGDPTITIDVEVLLGYTTRAPSALSPIFANNPSGGMVSVYRSTAHAITSTSRPLETLTDFDLVLPLDTPFVTATGPGHHLLVELRVYGNDRCTEPFGLNFDAVFDPNGPVRVIGHPSATTGTLEPLNLVIGIATAGAPRPTRAPRIDGGGDANLGGAHDIALRDAPPGAAASLLTRNVTSCPPISLIDLTALGAPGCLLCLPSGGALASGADASGQARIAFSITPGSTALVGAEFEHQWIVLDMGANPLGLTVTGSCRVSIGG